MKRILFLSAILFVSPAFTAVEKEVSFDQALKTLFEANTSVAIQKNRVNSAHAELVGSRFHFLPTLTLSASDQKANLPDVETKTLEASTKFNLFRFGADVARLDASRYSFDEQSARLRSEELVAEDTIVKALVLVIQRSQQLRVAELKFEYSKRLQDIAQARFKRGLLPREQADQVAIDLSNDEASVRDAQSLLNIAFAQVAALSERATLDPSRLNRDWPWRDRFTTAEIQRLATQAIDPGVSPELKAAQLDLASQQARAKQYKRAMFPSLDFSYSAQKFDIDPGSRGNAWVSLFTLSVPLFEGLTDFTAYKVQNFEAQIAAERERQTLRDVPVRQTLAQKNFAIAYQTALTREKNLSIARRLLDSSLARFRAGRANADALAFDQNRMTQAEIFAVDGWAQAHLALMELAHSFGRSIR